MNTAEYIVKRLEELGVNHFFGVPGDYNFNILNAVQSSQNINWISCTNELNAGYAADGYARLKGYGALVTTYGVGELSALNAIAGSFAENIPVINIVGLPATKSISDRELIHHNFQDVNYFTFSGIYKNVTAANTLLTRDNAKLEIDRVLKICVKEKMPVYIAIPSDIATMEISDRYTELEWESDKETLSAVVDKIAQKINNSKLPVILGDVLVKRFDAEIEYKEFVEKSKIPVTNLMMGVNLIDSKYENYLGGYYADLKNPIAQKYVNESDCMIAIGTIYSDINSFGQSLPYKINNHVGIYGTYTYIDGVRYDNVKMVDVLSGIAKNIEPKNIEIEKPNIGYKIKQNEGENLDSEFIYARLQEYFKENDIIITDTGSAPFGICQTGFDTNVCIEFQSLWGSIGWGTPATLGASLAKPNSRVILVTGDGAHQMTAMEIGTMLKLGLKPIIILINNKGYTVERYLSKDFNNKYNDIVNMNYSKFARVFEGDVWAIKSNTSEDFDKALKVTQIMNKMCYLELCTVNDDIPKLAKDFIEKQSKTVNDKPIQTQNMKSDFSESNSYKDVDLTTFSSSGSEYETVVHTSFITEENDNEEGKNNEE